VLSASIIAHYEFITESVADSGGMRGMRPHTLLSDWTARTG